MDILGLIGGIASSFGTGQGLLGGLLSPQAGPSPLLDGADPADVLASSVGSFLGGGSDDASNGLGLLGSVAGLLA